MPQEKVRKFLMDREDKRFARYIIIMVLLGILIVLTPYVCIKVKRAQMEAQGYEWVARSAIVIVLLAQDMRAIGNQLVIDL